MLSKSFLEMLRQRNSKKNGELKKLKKPPRWLDPLTAERGYIASLAVYSLDIRLAIEKYLMPKIPVWLGLTTRTYPDPVEIENLDCQSSEMSKKKQDSANLNRKDDLIDDILDDLNATLEFIDNLLQIPELKAIEASKKFGLEVAIFNQKQFEKTTESVLGVDIFVEEPWLETQIEIFANQNATLIKNLTDTQLNRVSGIIQRGLQQGTDLDTITDDIQETFGMTRRHAKLIARDQTTKLNANLTKLRQEEIGVENFRWLTSGDERVRASHEVLDGKICRWDDPTVFLDEKTGKWVKKSTIGGSPVHCGVDVNCRCQPIAMFETMFD